MRQTLMVRPVSQQGFTLVELAIVILIFGLIVGSVFAFYSPQLDQKRYQLTVQRQEKVARAFADYAQRVGRLPCPSPTNPYSAATGDVMGRPVGWTAANPWGSCNPAASRTGIVPFRDLGLTQDDVTDAYGNPFSYTVSRELSENVGATAYRNYRTTVWIPDGITNANTPKALLCGQRVNNTAQQLEVYNSLTMTNANHVTQIQEDNSPSPADFVNPNIVGTQLVGREIAYFAYVLVSHGKNGEGAYRFSLPTWDAPAARKTYVNAFTSDERNADDDREFVVLPRSSTQTNASYFDDIVLWRTQEGLIRDSGDTCARP